MQKDNTGTIFRSAARFFSGTMLSRLTGLGRDMAMTFSFGTQGPVAAFFMAFRFSHLARRLLGEGSLQSSFIPQFEELRKDNPERAAQFFRDLSSWMVIILCGLVGTSMMGLYGLIYGFNFSSGTQDILYYTFLMMPSLFFICLYGINAALLECEQSYFTPSVAPIAFNGAWIVAALILWQVPVEQAMPWLCLAVVIGCGLQWAMTLPKTIKILRKYPGSSYSPFSPDVKRLLKPLLLANLGVAASQINNALDPIFARYAETEGPAWLWYSIRVQQLPLALFGIALSGALLPPLSRSIKIGDIQNFKHFLDYAVQRIIGLMIPLTMVIFVMGGTIINLLFGRGDFQDESILGTTWCLWGYGAGLIPMTLVLILAPALYAMNDYKTPSRASVWSMGVNVALNTLFIVALNGGAASVAFATSLAAWGNALYLFYTLHQRVGEITTQAFWMRTAKTSVASLLAGVTVVLIRGNFLTTTYPTAFLDQVTSFAMDTAIFSILFFSLLWILNRLPSQALAK